MNDLLLAGCGNNNSEILLRNLLLSFVVQISQITSNQLMTNQLSRAGQNKLIIQVTKFKLGTWLQSEFTLNKRGRLMTGERHRGCPVLQAVQCCLWNSCGKILSGYSKHYSNVLSMRRSKHSLENTLLE